MRISKRRRSQEDKRRAKWGRGSRLLRRMATVTMHEIDTVKCRNPWSVMASMREARSWLRDWRESQ